MKSCPNCGEVLGTHADSCFKCNYNFRLRRVVSSVERNRADEIRQTEINRQNELIERQREREIAAQIQKNEFIQQLPLYEYATEKIRDNSKGAIDVTALDSVLYKYSREGWRLHSVLTNELGKNSYSAGVGGYTSGVNSTIEETILIFERLISKGTL